MVKLNLSLQSCFLFSSSASFSASCCARLPGNGASGPTPSAAATAGAESTFTGGSAGAFRETQRRRGSFCQARSTMRMSRSLGVGWRWWLLGKNRWILLVNLGISSKNFEVRFLNAHPFADEFLELTWCLDNYSCTMVLCAKDPRVRLTNGE